MNILHDLTESADQMSGVNLAERSVVTAKVLGLRDQLLPTRVAGEQWPLLAPENTTTITKLNYSTET